MNNSYRVIFITGVSGSGKSTIGQLLSEKLQIPYFDGDDFHSPSNILKMSNRQPLTDDDRQSWLVSLNALAKKQLETNSCIIGCSALKQQYREILSKGIESQTKWVHLRGTFDQILERLKKRSGHFMPKELLKSQFDLLEESTGSLNIDIDSTPNEIVRKIVDDLDTQ